MTSTLSKEVIISAFGRLANQQCVLTESEIKQQEAAKRASDTRRARKEKQKQQQLELSHAAELLRLEEQEAVRKQEEEKKQLELEEATRVRLAEEHQKQLEEEAATAQAAAHLARLLQEEEEKHLAEQKLQHERMAQQQLEQEVSALQQKLNLQHEEAQRLREEAQEKESRLQEVLGKFDEQQKQMEALYAMMELKYQEAQQQQQANEEKKKIEEADRFAQSNTFFPESEFNKEQNQQPPKSTAPEELKDLPKNCNLIKQNAMRQAFIWLTFGAGVVETTNEVLGEPFLKADGFSDRVIVALQQGKFNQGLEALALQPGAMKVLGDPYNSLAGTFMSELMQTHLSNKKKIEEGGFQRRGHALPPSTSPPAEDDEKHNPAKTPVDSAHKSSGTCFCASCMPAHFATFCKTLQQQQQVATAAQSEQDRFEHEKAEALQKLQEAHRRELKAQKDAQEQQQVCDQLKLQTLQAQLFALEQQRAQQQADVKRAEEQARMLTEQAESKLSQSEQLKLQAQMLALEQQRIQEDAHNTQMLVAEHARVAAEQGTTQTTTVDSKPFSMPLGKFEIGACPSHPQPERAFTDTPTNFEARRRENARSESLERTRTRETVSYARRHRSRSRYNSSRDHSSHESDSDTDHETRPRRATTFTPAVSAVVLASTAPPLQENVGKHVSWQQQAALGFSEPTVFPTVDKKTGEVRPSFTTTPRTRAALVGRETLENFQAGISRWGPVLEHLPNLMDCMQGGSANILPQTPQISF